MQPGSMDAGIVCEHFFKILFSPKATMKSMLHTFLASVCKFLNAEQKSSLQVPVSSNDQDHADGNVECHGLDASEGAVGDDSNKTTF
jgi:hypothetical protein